LSFLDVASTTASAPLSSVGPKDSTSYDYGIKTDNADVSFDVYFVRTLQERTDFFLDTQSFDYYDDQNCFGQNKQRYSGT